MKRTGMNMGLVRKQNHATILNYINENGPVSRKDIAQATGLTPASVTQNTTLMLDEELLVEVGSTSEKNKAGRKKILLDIYAKGRYILAVNIEPKQTVVALADMKGNLVDEEIMVTDTAKKPEDFLKDIAAVCLQMENNHEKIKDQIAGIGVGITGIVDETKAISRHAYGIWKEEVAVGKILSEQTGFMVRIENNVNAFANAELLYGVGRKYDNLLVIKWGPGVGSTIIIDNDIYEGRNGKAAELGHFIVAKDGKSCSCGRCGCLETEVSYAALQQIHPFEPEEFGMCYEKTEEKERKEFDEAIDLFARTIVNSMTILAPNRVVLYGSLFHSEVIRKKLIESCSRYDKRFNEHRILYSTLANREEYIGPVATFVEHAIF